MNVVVIRPIIPAPANVCFLALNDEQLPDSKQTFRTAHAR